MSTHRGRGWKWSQGITSLNPSLQESQHHQSFKRLQKDVNIDTARSCNESHLLSASQISLCFIVKDVLQNQPFEAGVHVAFLEFGFGFVVLWVAVAVLFPDRFVGPDVYAVGRIELITFRGETNQPYSQILNSFIS